MRTPLLLLLALVTVPVIAQDSPAPFTQVEGLRVQNVNLRGELLRRDVAQYQADQAALKADIEKARPGWIWSPETGQFARAHAQ